MKTTRVSFTKPVSNFASSKTGMNNFLDATVDRNGVVRWKSNGQVPNQKVLDEWEKASWNFDMEASQKARAEDFKNFAKSFRK